MELLNPCSDATFAAQAVTYTGTAGTTTAIPPGPQGVLIWCDSAAYVRVANGTTAVTTATGTPIPANTPIAFTTPSGRDGQDLSWSVSAIQVSAGGTLYVKPINSR